MEGRGTRGGGCKYTGSFTALFLNSFNIHYSFFSIFRFSNGDAAIFQATPIKLLSLDLIIYFMT